MTGFRLVHSATIHDRAGAYVDPAPALQRRYRLPTFARNHDFHRGDPRLQRALHPLQGKFSVVNPAIVTALPPGARGALETQLTTGMRRGHGPGPLTVALHEPLDPVVMHESRAAPGGAMPGRDIFFWAELRYRLALGGADAADPHAATTAVGSGRAERWFHTALLIPDAEAIRQMAPTTAHFYRFITGRLGQGSEDRYWYLDAWERFQEEGRVIGYLSPALVEHGRPGGSSTNRAPEPAAPTYEDILFGDAEPISQHGFGPYSPNFDRRGFVPPAYCLIHYFATVELARMGATVSTAA